MVHAREDYNRIQDPLGKIGEDEPVFLVRAQDRTASACVRSYAQKLLDEGGDAEIAALCFTHAMKMDAWREKHGGGKMPDLP